MRDLSKAAKTDQLTVAPDVFLCLFLEAALSYRRCRIICLIKQNLALKLLL